MKSIITWEMENNNYSALNKGIEFLQERDCVTTVNKHTVNGCWPIFMLGYELNGVYPVIGTIQSNDFKNGRITIKLYR